MTDLTLRLATCDDADVLATELIAVLPDLAATQDLQASVQGVAAFLAEEEERWSSCVHNLLLYLRGEPQERNVVLELLDATLFSAAQWQGQLTLKTQKTLVEFFQTVITEIGNGGDSGRWLKWGDQVLILVYKQREQEQVAEEKEDAEESRQWFVDIAGLLLQLRNTLAGNEAVSPDLKLETFVWKNLAKLATAFGPILTSCSAAINSPSKEQDGDKQETGRFGAEEAVAAVVSSVEESVGQLLRGASAGVLDAGVLKFFRLYWKAFHRLLVAFADVLDSEVENCVLAIVNVAASLIYIIQQNKDSAMSKGGQELRNMLDQAVEMIEKMTGSAAGAENDQAAGSRLLTLLWYPSADMIRAIGQRQSSDIGVKSSIQWGHLLLLTASVGLGEPGSAGDDAPIGDAKRALDTSQLFARFRECTLSDSISRCGEMTEMFMDLLLVLFGRFGNILELQLTLLKHTLYPDWMQRTLCWEIWRELLCFCWDETVAVQALQLLLDIMQWEDDGFDTTFVLAHGVDGKILQLVAFVYEDMPIALKDVCMDQVTASIDAISGEGPCHQFNLRVASQLQLLEKLGDVQFLKYYDGPMKDEWIAKYLPMCFECCGTVLELLANESSALNTKHETILGMIRVLDMCLLVLRGVLDDNEPRQDDVAELSIILVRMSTEALSQIAKQGTHSSRSPLIGNKRQAIKGPSSSIKLKQAESRCVGRVVETSLYLLSRLGPVLKVNKNNQCVQVMQDLLSIIDNTQRLQQLEDGSTTLVATAQFLKTTLSDIQVADGDVAVVWQLMFSLFQKLFDATYIANRQRSQLTLLLSVCLDALYELLAHSNVPETLGAPLNAMLAGNLKQTFRQSASMRKLSRNKAIDAVEVAQPSILKCLRRNQGSCHQAFRKLFPEEPMGINEETGEDNQDISAVSNKRPSDDDETFPQKRHKLAHFVSLCREIESSLSSFENDAAAMNLLSGKELEEATAVLHQLLAKTVALCP